MMNKGLPKINIRKDESGEIRVSFSSYQSILVKKIKNIKGGRWHPDEKYWSFPNTNGILEKIFKVFESEEINLDPALQSQHPSPLIVKDKIAPAEADKQFLYNFEDLRRELVSRKYSYKTIKAYIYFNKDFLNFSGKRLPDINDDDIKNYLLHLAENKQSATSTLNQAINALKFYYGEVLKRKFVYEIKRPRKDKKLPVILSQEEITKILSSVDNIKHKAILMLIYSAGLRVAKWSN